VIVTNGENKICAKGGTQAEEWYQATLQAEAVGCWQRGRSKAALDSERLPATELRDRQILAPRQLVLGIAHMGIGCLNCITPDTVEPESSTCFRIIMKVKRPQSRYRQERPQVPGRPARGKGRSTALPQSPEEDNATHH
jgi:hypothetical protein